MIRDTVSNVHQLSIASLSSLFLLVFSTSAAYAQGFNFNGPTITGATINSNIGVNLSGGPSINLSTSAGGISPGGVSSAPATVGASAGASPAPMSIPSISVPMPSNSSGFSATVPTLNLGSFGTITPLDQERGFARRSVAGYGARPFAMNVAVAPVDDDLIARMARCTALEPCLEGKDLTLYRGYKNSVVKTSLGQVVPNTGSVFAIKETPDGVRIFNISGINLTFVTADGYSLTINPGNEAYISSAAQSAPFAKDSSVARRVQINSARVGEAYGYFARFSIGSLLKHADMDQLRSHEAIAEHKRLFHHIVKMAVIMNHMYGADGFVKSQELSSNGVSPATDTIADRQP